MTAPTQTLLLAQRALVQFPRNPVVLGFSVMPVLIMYLVFGGLFEGVAQLPGFPTDNYFEYLAPRRSCSRPCRASATPASRWRPTSRAATSTSC